MKLTLNGHQDKIVAELEAIIKAVQNDKPAYLGFEGDVKGEIEFLVDNEEFSPDDTKLYAEQD